MGLRGITSHGTKPNVIGEPGLLQFVVVPRIRMMLMTSELKQSCRSGTPDFSSMQAPTGRNGWPKRTRTQMNSRFGWKLFDPRFWLRWPVFGRMEVNGT